MREITRLGRSVTLHAHEHVGRAWDLPESCSTHDKRSASGCDTQTSHRSRFRFSHPAHRDLPSWPPYLHLPGNPALIQFCCDEPSAYSAILSRAAWKPCALHASDIALLSDSLSGPGESVERLRADFALVRAVDYAQAYAFKFSPRPGTPAAARDSQIPEEIKRERLAGLQQILAAQQLAFNHKSLGKIQEVLLTEEGKVSGQCKGRGPWMQSVSLLAPQSAIGQFVHARIESQAARTQCLLVSLHSKCV